jgi:carboxyl-terminal processing protease
MRQPAASSDAADGSVRPRGVRPPEGSVMPKRNLVVFGCVALLTVLVWAYRPSHADRNTYYDLFTPVVDVYGEIEKRYVAEVDPRKVRDGAIEGMLDKLDPFSNYIPAEDAAEFQKQMRGEFGGIGIQIGIKDQKLTVISPLEDTPAFRAGVLAGDWIKEIDGRSTFDPKPMTLQEAVGKLTGKPGTKVTITVVHEGDNKEHKIELTRAIIRIQSVKGWRRTGDGSKWDFMMDPKNKLGYVRLTGFLEETDRELDNAVNSMLAAGAKGMVLDLRFNPGGLLKQATDIADRFLKKGVIVSTSGRKSPRQEWVAKEEGTYADFELVVLINEYSASASEILAGALKDHGRATLVGVRTFGKGSVQNVIPLDDGKSLLKLTTAYYYLPGGKCIHKLDGAKEWGVDPDREVLMTPAEAAALLKARRDADVIRGPGGAVEKTEPKPAEAVDKQLDVARDVLLGRVMAGESRTAR